MKERPILFSSAMVRAILEGRKTQTRRVVKFPKHWTSTAFAQARWIAKEHEHAIPGWFFQHADGGGGKMDCPYGQPGDRLWVRETVGRKVASFLGIEATNGVESAFYVADGEDVLNEHEFNLCPWWKGKSLPSIHMPRWASRIMLEIVSVKVERLQDISEDDAIAEGIDPYLGGRAESETWWQGYDSRFTDRDGNLSHTQVPRVDSPPDWLLEPKKMVVNPIPIQVVPMFQSLWESINGKDSWQANPWVWVVEFKRLQPTTANA